MNGKLNTAREAMRIIAKLTAAAAVNFPMILIASRAVFNLPFKGLDEIPESRSLLAGLHLQPRKTG